MVNTSYIWPRDVRTLASINAQTLASFCFISKWQIAAALSTLGLSSLITTNVLRSSLVSAQGQNEINILNETVTQDFMTIKSGMQLSMRGNQLASGLQTLNIWQIDQSNNGDTILSAFSIW